MPTHPELSPTCSIPCHPAQDRIIAHRHQTAQINPGVDLEQYPFRLNRIAINKAMKLLDKIWLEWVGFSRSRSSPKSALIGAQTLL
jgi:hypothetical protein